MKLTIKKQEEQHQNMMLKEEIENIKSQQLIEMNQRHNNEIESIKKAMKMMQ